MPATPDRRPRGHTFRHLGGGTLKQQWLNHCVAAALTPPTLYTGARKIIRPMRLTFTSLDNSLTLADAGYTGSKLTALTKHYLHLKSRHIATQLWAKRRAQEKYGSVSFTTFNHFVKGGGINAKRSKRASVFGPCLQSIVITWLDKQHYSVDVFYRTTELLKKFPADLVLIRDVLIKPFDFDGLRLHELTCHFANVTIHPLYFATIVPHISNPVEFLKSIKDPYFHNWLVKWLGRMICPEYLHGLEKFSQGMRVRKDANKRIDKKTLRILQAYVRKNHPGIRGYPKEDNDE